MARVIIIGGHGKIALRLARLLTARGDAVSSVIRNQAQSDDIIATGATLVGLMPWMIESGAVTRGCCAVERRRHAGEPRACPARGGPRSGNG